jgi:hypothetical protein
LLFVQPELIHFFPVIIALRFLTPVVLMLVQKVGAALGFNCASKVMHVTPRKSYEGIDYHSQPQQHPFPETSINIQSLPNQANAGHIDNC